MKKLLFVLATLFILAPTAYADYDIGECCLPNKMRKNFRNYVQNKKAENIY